MPKLIRFKDPADQVRESVETPPQKISIQNKGNFERMVSTGSTLLDLAISGGRVRGGGIPGGRPGSALSAGSRTQSGT